MTEPQKPSLLLAIFAALLALQGLPVGFALFVGSADDLAQALNEGGSGMYLVLLGALATAVAGAVGAAFAVYGKPLVWAGSIFLALGTFGAGVFAYRTAMSDSFRAIEHASPMDRAVIMNGATAESGWTMVFAALLLAGLFAAQGLALWLAAVGARDASLRRGLVLLGAGMICVGVWQGLLGAALKAQRDTFWALAHASPSDRFFLLVASLEAGSSWQDLTAAALVGVVLLTVLAGVLLRETPRVLVGVVAGILIPTAGLGGLRAFVRPNAEETALLAAPRIARELFELDAAPVDGLYPFVTQGTELRDEANEVVRVEQLQLERTGRSGGLELGLAPSVKLELLATTLGALRARGVNSVMLIGAKTTPEPAGLRVPPLFRQHFTQTRGLRVLLGRLHEDCPAGACVWATMDEKALSVGGERWPLVTKSSAFDDGKVDFERAIPFKLEGRTLEQLFAAANTAAQNDRLLAIYFGAEQP